MSDPRKRYHLEEWFEFDPSHVIRDIVLPTARSRKRPRSTLSSHLDCWKVPRLRANPKVPDPRISKYALILGHEWVVATFPHAITRLQLVLDLDLTLIEAIREDTILTPLTRSQLEKNSVRCPPMLVAKRPGLEAFLAVVAKYYDLWLWAGGGGEYVRQVLSAIDPSGDYFRGRVISSGDRTQLKSLQAIPGLGEKLDLALVLDDQPETWHNDTSVITSKIFAPSGLTSGKSETSFSTLAQKFTFTCLRPGELLAGSSDLQLEHLMQALTQTYFSFISNKEATTAAYEFSEMRKKVLSGEAFSFTAYTEKVEHQVEGYTKDRYKLYHFAVIALGGMEDSGKGVKVEEKQGQDCVAGKWLVQCFLHCYKV